MKYLIIILMFGLTACGKIEVDNTDLMSREEICQDLENAEIQGPELIEFYNEYCVKPGAVNQ